METKIDFIITEEDIYETIRDAKRNNVRQIYNSLCKGNYLNTKDLCQLSEGEVRRLNRMGKIAIQLLKKYLNAKGKTLKQYKK